MSSLALQHRRLAITILYLYLIYNDAAQCRAWAVVEVGKVFYLTFSLVLYHYVVSKLEYGMRMQRPQHTFFHLVQIFHGKRDMVTNSQCGLSAEQTKHPILSSSSMQSYGTDKVGWFFAPIALLWFLMMGGVGLVVSWVTDVHIITAWTEALFADLDHFPVLVVRIAFTLIVFPSLRPIGVYRIGCLPYEEPGHIVHAFYHSIPSLF
ncbi:hypothetical protein IFM89_024224 [Coptis chinensis]|uniref:K+ potassium transporter integral membrane domain-containing protein n=1 Tax=Coptis chinensis TaxID=261450 RepID=A0A835LG88_9MAGN|nr:hypothetical protein IFM89_024224 [Coptis chinensis]